MEADGALEGMMGLALVETDLSLALETGVENPVDPSADWPPPNLRQLRTVAAIRSG